MKSDLDLDALGRHDTVHPSTTRRPVPHTEDSERADAPRSTTDCTEQWVLCFMNMWSMLLHVICMLYVICLLYVVICYADYNMYSTFLTVSPGSVLFSRCNLLKRKDLCFSSLRLGLIRHRRSLRSSHLSSQVCHDSYRVTLEKMIF